MEKQSFNLDKPKYFVMESLVKIHGWRQLAPFDYENNILSFAAYVEDEPVDIYIEEKEESIECSFFFHTGQTEELKSGVREIVIRVLSLDRNIDSLIKKSIYAGKEYEGLVKNGWNRLLRSSTLFEDFCKVLFTTNCSWSLTKKISSAICNDEFSDITPCGRFPFPKPERVNQYSAEELKSMIPIGYRNESLKILCDKFSRYSDSWIEGKNIDDSFNQVLSLKGFGHYAASHMMIILDFFKEIPTDSVVVNYLKKHHGVEKKEAASFMKEHYKEWGDNFWWGFKLESVLKFMENGG